jgi:mannitol 2-dehydrogenase
MVDRITPAAEPAHRELVREIYGVEDACPVIAEAFSQWVLEDRFPQGRPPWERAGVQLVPDVRPYELMKLRLLNASHQAIAYLGLLAGFETADQAVASQPVSTFLARYMAEASATLPPVDLVELPGYQCQLLERFSNHDIRDRLARLATDGSDRIPKFVVPVLRHRQTAGLDSPYAIAILAAWARYVELALQPGSPLPFSDRQDTQLHDAVRNLPADPASFLDQSAWFGQCGRDPMVRRQFTDAYRLLARATTRPGQTGGGPAADLVIWADSITGPGTPGTPVRTAA